MSDTRKVQNGDTIKIHYKCTLDDGTVASDSKMVDEPLEFGVGTKTVLSGLDENVLGMEVGEEKSFVLEPDRGYGDYFEERISNMPKENIPSQFIDQLGPGSVIPLMSKDGTQRLVATIVEIQEEEIVVDLNHPLAGKTLNFEVEVIDIVSSEGVTEEDLEPTLTTETTSDTSDPDE